MMESGGVGIEHGKYGPRAVVKGPWCASIQRYLKDCTVREIELNYANGWSGDSVEFLREFPELRAVKIVDWKIRSVDAVNALTELRSLDISTYCRTVVQFDKFANLEQCSIEWRPGIEAIFDCASLQNLFVNRYRRSSADSFGQLVNLRSLAVLNAPIENIHGLCTLTKLLSLRLGNLKRLRSLAGLESLELLNELNVDTCPKIESIGEVAQVGQLAKLNLSNCGRIASLKPLRALKRLEMVTFYESTDIVDGDLSPLLELPRLVRVSFRNRRHYSHRREEFGALYGPR